MSGPNRRRYLCLAGSAVSTVIAGCIGDGSETTDKDDSDSSTDSENETGTDSETQMSADSETDLSVVQPSGGDTNITFALDSRVRDFETLVVDVDRAEFIGDIDTEDVTVQIGDTGLDLTTLTDGAKTYLKNRPFPSGTYTRVDLYATVQENTLSEGGSATFEYELPISREGTREISDDQYQNFTYTLAPRQDFGESTYKLDIVGSVAYGRP